MSLACSTTIDTLSGKITTVAHAHIDEDISGVIGEKDSK